MPKRDTIDELNLANLNLIAAMDTTDLAEWDIEFESRGQGVRVMCKAASGDVVPHGLDGDVSAALLHLFLKMGMPEEGVLSFNITTLLKACKWRANGDYFRQLRTSLERLHTTNYTVSNGWREVGGREDRWTHAKFHFIESLEFDSTDKKGAFDEKSMITLRLAQKVVSSIRSGYVKPLDLEVMLAFKRPRTRTIYRILDGARYDLDQPDTLLGVIEYDLEDWADLCKIPKSRAANIKRALAAPHEELMAQGYLKEVAYFGRGMKQRVRYEFGDPKQTTLQVQKVRVSPALENRFSAYGVTIGVARKIVRKLGEERTHSELDRFETLKKRGEITPRTPARMLNHFFENLDSYPTIEAVPAPSKLAPLPEPDDARPVESPFQAPPTPELANLLNKRLEMFFGKKLTQADYETLKARVLSGQLEMDVVYQRAIAASMPEKQVEFLTWLYAEFASATSQSTP
ncbi:hypothetical protein Dxin01_00861 [Deinococcus xinjiangensis]|uniref:Replication initiator protein A n=1 Tax=Deinococcus xinjiangensis TaxID=457454 RepID=A0ABP9V9C5_9DEIO